MDNLTHTLTGVALARMGLEKRWPGATLTLALASNLPDVDIVSGLFGRLAYLDHHRAITHAFPASLLLAAPLALLLTRWPKSERRFLANSVLYLVTGNIYDNMANPKEKGTGKDLPKPKAFDEYFKTAETNYTKAVELSISNKEIQYNSLYNLGAMYNNYGGYLQNKKVEGKITDLQKLQKEQDAKSQEYYKKAIPLLEKALGIKNDDKATMVALRKLYLITGDEAKGKEMNERIKGGK